MVLNRATVIALASSLPLVGAIPARAACARSETAVRTEVVSDPVVVEKDYTAEELRARGGRHDAETASPHPRVLRCLTGYQFTVVPQSADVCSGFDVDVRLVSSKRVIELAKDLDGSPCMMKAALRHYRLHEAAQTAALEDSGRHLQPALRHFVGSRPALNGTSMESLVTEFMTAWLDNYEAGIPGVRDRVDTAANVSALVHACDL